MQPPSIARPGLKECRDAFADHHARGICIRAHAVGHNRRIRHAQTVDQRNVLISYGHADANWVRTLAENLHQSGLDVFFDEWETPVDRLKGTTDILRRLVAIAERAKAA